MRVEAGVKKVGRAALRAAARRLGPHGLTRLLLRSTTEHELRAVVAELLNRESVLVEVERDGVRWCVPSGDEIFTELFVTGTYHLDDVLAVDAWVGAHLDRAGRETIVDVGANIGTTTCPLARAGRRVVAIEPVPDTYAVLRRNVELQRLDERVIAVNGAIAAAVGHVEMAVTAGSGSNEVVLDGVPPAFEQWGMHTRSTVTVATAPLTDVVAQAGVSVDDLRFVWSDTQGFEGDVVASGAPLWAAGVPLYLEVWPRALDRRYTLDGFLTTVTDSFTGYVTSADLRRPGARARPISGLAPFIASIDTWSDALLIP